MQRGRGRPDIISLFKEVPKAFLLQEPPWLSSVRRGDWQAIPGTLDYIDSGEFAMLLDGYRAAQILVGNDRKDGSTAARLIYDQQVESYAQRKEWRGSAVELWATLFFEHRRSRFIIKIHPPKPGEEYSVAGPPDLDPKFDTIVAAIRSALLLGDVWPEAAKG